MYCIVAFQVKIWFQNRRMKWRNSKERELLSSGGNRQSTIPNKSNPNPDLSDPNAESMDLSDYEVMKDLSEGHSDAADLSIKQEAAFDPVQDSKDVHDMEKHLDSSYEQYFRGSYMADSDVDSDGEEINVS